MRRWLARLGLGALLGLMATLAFADSTSPPARPTWCQPGWECVPRQELADATEQIWQLRSDLAATRARAKRLGLTIGVGAGVGGVLTTDWGVAWVPTCGIFVVYGIRF